MSPLLFVLRQFAIVAYAPVGGVFIAFSDFNVRSLSLMRGAGRIEALQDISREVFRRVFMTLFPGMAVVSLVIVGYAATRISGPPDTLALAAGAVYLVGCFGVAVVFNVPMKEALAGMDLSVPATRAYWLGTYPPGWILWNSVRTLASVLAAVLLLLALNWSVQVQTLGG